MIEESKELLEAMGIVVIQAPSEGEMQCAHLVKKGVAWAVGSQDYDALVVGGKRLIQNLTLARKRKTVSGEIYIAPEMNEYEKSLNDLGLDSDQLISLAILVGPDYNPGGIKGIGPKKALKLIKENVDYESIFQAANWPSHYPDLDWRELFSLIKQIPVTDDYHLEWEPVDSRKIIELLVEGHDFSRERVVSKLDYLQAELKKYQQKGLKQFF